MHEFQLETNSKAAFDGVTESEKNTYSFWVPGLTHLKSPPNVFVDWLNHQIISGLALLAYQSQMGKFQIH